MSVMYYISLNKIISLFVYYKVSKQLAGPDVGSQSPIVRHVRDQCQITKNAGISGGTSFMLNCPIRHSTTIFKFY